MYMLMLMYMLLTKRANILFEDPVWSQLLTLAQAQKASVGSLIRHAVQKVYFSTDQSTLAQNALNNILQIRPKTTKGKINYKELVNYGRKI